MESLAAITRPLPHGGEQALGVDGGADGRHLPRRAEMGEQAVIAAAAGDRLVDARGFDLEHQARVIFEAAAELGGEDRAPRSMPLSSRRSKRRVAA